MRSHQVGEIVGSRELSVHPFEVLFGNPTGPSTRQSDMQRDFRPKYLIKKLAEWRKPNTMNLVDDFAQQHVYGLAHQHDRGFVASL